MIKITVTIGIGDKRKAMSRVADNWLLQREAVWTGDNTFEVETRVDSEDVDESVYDLVESVMKGLEFEIETEETLYN